MSEQTKLLEAEKESDAPDPDETPIRDRKVVTQPYDVGVESLLHQIDNGTIFLRPMSERPAFQRRYVWNNRLASRLIESIILKVPIPPCYLSQNDDYEQDVIDGQQRIYSIYRFCKNHFKLSGLHVISELNGKSFHSLPSNIQRQIMTHSLRCVLITNESHPEVKFEVFERLNTSTMPLTAQELRNCVYRGDLIDLIKDAVVHQGWLSILGKKAPDKRMRDEELVLRFVAFYTEGLSTYKTPQKHWLNEVAKKGRRIKPENGDSIRQAWATAIENSLTWFEPHECYRSSISDPPRAINKAIFDLVAQSAASVSNTEAKRIRKELRKELSELLSDEEFQDLISRSVDHTKRTRRRFDLWREATKGIL